jgi:HAE1 family hydrophobic/amphiphilic exporter-1
MIEAFVNNPVKVSVGVLLVALFGVIALFAMPMQLTPEVQTPTLTIETVWPGASPQEVEREIVQEQEEQLKSVEGVTKMTSESMDAMGRITMEFLVGTNMEEALLKVNTKLQQVREYPEDADQPVINTSNASDRPIAWFMLTQRVPSADELRAVQTQHPDLAAEMEPLFDTDNPGLIMLRLKNLAEKRPQLKALIPPEIDITTYRKFAEDFVESEFERVSGVSNSNVIGGREEEMQVIVDPQLLAARQLTINDVRRALRAQNKDTSGGDFWEGKRRYVIRTLGQFRSPEQVANSLLARRDGKPVYVHDVATVQLGYKKADGLVRRFGNSNIAVNAMRQTGANVLRVMDGLRDATKRLNEGILAQHGLQLTQVYDETEYIYSSIGMVNDNILYGGLLTMICLLVFLRSIRSTIVIGLAIPTSIIGTFLMLHLMGRSLNVISLAGLAFAVGMLVDNAVVVLENIFRHHQLGAARYQAVIRGTTEVWSAVLASTLTTLAVFIPVVFVQEEAGQLFRDIALAISAAVGLSLIVSVVVVPAAAAKFLSENFSGNSASGPQTPSGWLAIFSPLGQLLGLFMAPLDWFARTFVASIIELNAFLQRSVLLRFATVLGMTAASFGLSYLLMPKVEYLPTGNRNLVFGILVPPPGYNLDQLLALGDEIEARLRPYWDINPKSPEAAKLDFPPVGDFFFVARGRMVFLGLRAADPQRAAELVGLVQRVATGLPGTFAIAKQSSLFEQGLDAGRTIDIEITGPELPKLVGLGGRVMGQVQQVFAPPPATGAGAGKPKMMGVQAIPKPSLDLSSPEVHVIPKWEQAADMGVTAEDLGYTVDALVDGAYAGDYFFGGDKIDLTIVGQQRYSKRTQDIQALPIATPSGELIPLAALAHIRLSSGPEQINHRERLRAVTIQVSPPPEVALEDAMERIQAQIVLPMQKEEGTLGVDYRIRLAGTADKLRSTWEALQFNVILALLITYLLMAALFESWLYPFVVILSVPLGAVGGVGALALMNLFVLQPLDVLTMLGFVILIGTVVNNPILIVEQALIHIREDGMTHQAAVLESVRNRIRPIFMTTTTTVLGLIPLVLLPIALPEWFPSAGSELYRGLGCVVLGGLLVSTLFTLVLVPALFTLTLEAQEALWRQLGWTLRPAQAASKTAAGPHADRDFEPHYEPSERLPRPLGDENGNGNGHGNGSMPHIPHVVSAEAVPMADE